MMVNFGYGQISPDSSDVGNEIKTIKQLDWARLNIPAYQRPYKWTAKNVNQLITDINSFKNYSAYRIGTLVLHNHGDKLYIVDGQQRMVTLSLLLFYFFNDEKLSQTRLAKNNADLKENVIEVFAQNIKFNDRYSLYNVIENWNTIDTRKDDLTEDFYDFLLNKCQMVEVTLTNLSEAFQFFDSQNARGKDLEPHDLLKAFHLREIVSDKLSASDKKNLTLWQDTQKLSYLFQLLYQAKNWSLGSKAWTFTKDQIMEFKGVSLNDKNKKRYPFYQLEIIAHVYLEYYTKSPDRIVDGVEMEYPYNLDDQIINGSRFFDMIRHYLMLYDKVCNPGMYKKWTMAYDIMEPVINNTYQGAYRTGDQYVRSMFITTLIYYVDRFGFGDELNRIVPKIFLWAYSCRLKNRSVRWNTVENYVIDTSPMLSSIHKSHAPEDILNITIEAISENEKLCGKCDEIKKNSEIIINLSKMNETEELSIKKLLSNKEKYVIPLYQRNYDWGEKETLQLLDDIADYAKKEKNGQSQNYYIGTLVVHELENAHEIIDGQQRMTTLTLLLCAVKNDKTLRSNIDFSWFSDVNLSYINRDKANEALRILYKGEALDNISTPSMRNVYQHIQSSLDTKCVERGIDVPFFMDYLLNKVHILRVAVPQDTDLNHYFEIMNSRGEQLEKHEIVKALLMGKLEPKYHDAFKVIWEACSNMDSYVIRNFTNNKIRRVFFRDDNTMWPDEFEDLNNDFIHRNDNDETSSDNNSVRIKDKSICDLIEEARNNKRYPSPSESSNRQSSERFGSIINFPNFLHYCPVKVD